MKGKRFLVQLIVSQNRRSRGNPSGSKIRLLQHLEDCHFELARKCENNLVVLDLIIAQVQTFSPVTATNIALYEYLADLQDCRVDMMHLVSDLRTRGEAIPSMRDSIKDHMEVQYSFRNALITILLAVYVPIGFACVSLDLTILYAQ